MSFGCHRLDQNTKEILDKLLPYEASYAQGNDLAALFWDLSQNEKLSEIKLPLVVAIHAEKIKDLI